MSGSTFWLTLLCACFLLVAGCLSVGPATNESAAGPSETTRQTTRGWHERLENEYDPVTIGLENEWNRSVVMSVRVVRESTGETVYDERHEVPAETGVEVYSTARTNSDGVESFRVAVTARGTTRELTVETNACFGDVVGEVDEDGVVNLRFSIC